MPVPVKYVCPKCKGETDIPNTECIACSLEKLINRTGFKHVDHSIFNNDNTN